MRFLFNALFGIVFLLLLLVTVRKRLKDPMKLRTSKPPLTFILVLLTLFFVSISSSANRPVTIATSKVPASDSKERKRGKFPVLMRTLTGAVVRRGLSENSSSFARVKPGAVLRMRRRGHKTPGCPEGWLERENRGFICGVHLHRERVQEAGPSPLDLPEVLRGFGAVKVMANDSKLYRNATNAKGGKPVAVLNEGSLLVVRGKVSYDDIAYFETRKGWYIRADQVEQLPPPLEDALGVDMGGESTVPGGIVIAHTRVYEKPDEIGSASQILDRWSVVETRSGQPLIVENGWVRLLSGGYVKDEALARIRPTGRPSEIGDDERWLAIDLEQQLLHAYRGDRLMRVIPCSTGIEDNTNPGKFRVQLKRRMQTLRPFRRMRVEDVQWVMYYYRKKGIAIHSAYWHHEFGKPVSHGCVNLPPKDARWVFEWSSPHMYPEDSERYPLFDNPGTKVIVFR
jgi:hypothetical protein